MDGLLLCCRLCGFRSRLVDGADDEGIERRRLALKPGGGDRAGGHQHPLADAAAQHVEGNEPRAFAVLQLDLQHGAAGHFLQAFGGPDIADHGCTNHGYSLSITTPNCRALSRANGVTATPFATVNLFPFLAAATICRSATSPLSMRLPPVF